MAFDLKEKKWLMSKLIGETLFFRNDSSICVYDNNTVILFGADAERNEDRLSILYFESSSNGNKFWEFGVE